VNRLLAAVAVVTAAACVRTAADHEELGDRAYAAGDYRDALAEYRLALRPEPTRGPLLAKAAAAALHTAEFAFATSAYEALAGADGTRADEAADGLERVVRAALAVNERVAGETALAALRALAPDRPLGHYARAVALDAAEQGRNREARELLPPAIAAAPDGRTQDSLLFAYATVAARLRDCDTAVPAFEAVIRRGREPGAAEAAREGLALCALILGDAALDAGRSEAAEDWYRRAAAPGATSDVARAAFLRLGDLRLARGDVLGAVESYQMVLQGGIPGDSLAVRAQQRINALGRADTPMPLQP
jgi:tetratricopeptide (TPR) repeat protein